MAYRFKLKGSSDGRRIIWDPGYEDIWNIQIRALKGKRIGVTIGPETKENSRQQQRYYRGVVVPEIAKHIGESVKYAHEILQYKFFTETDDNGFTRVRSTKLGEWTTVEWEEKMDEIRQWAQDFLGVRIALPNEIEDI